MYWDATYRVTTPLFLGGANPETDAELRPSTLKGLLRFWFRAIALSRLHEYSEVKNLENDIFGSTEKQSSFLLTIDQQEELSKINSGDNWQGYPGLRYLGYGVVDRNGKTTRPYLKPGGYFTVRLRAKKEAPKEAAFFLPLTLQALGLFGAAGSRSRNGFGSLSLESLTCNDEEIWKAPTTLEELKKCQKTLLNNIKLSKNNDSLPEYTAFSNQSRVWIAQAGPDALGLLNNLGYEMLRYRSYGHEINGKHMLPGQNEAEQIFADDLDLLLDFCHGNEITTHPRRVVFGLPHNYYFKSTGTNVDISPASKNCSRRASPLFIHIHAFNPRSYAAVVTLLPAIFLPQEEKVNISLSRNRRVLKKVTVDCQVDYDNIINFMNRPAFSQSKVVVWP